MDTALGSSGAETSSGATSVVDAALTSSGTMTSSDAAFGAVVDGALGSSGTGTSSSSGFILDAGAYCRVPSVDAGSLPFVVDTAFVPSGWMGDAPAYPATTADLSTGAPAIPGTTASMTLLPIGYGSIGDACSPDGVGRSSAGAKGNCWKVTYMPFPRTLEPGPAPGLMKVGGGPGFGWAGALWQYPRNNWGANGGGYPIPPGASRISFWARGAVGGERVLFFTGTGLGSPCSDYAIDRLMGPGGSYGEPLASPPAWQNYSIDISDLDYAIADVASGQGLGGYYGGVIGAFGFTVSEQTLPSAGPCPPDLICDPFSGPSAPPNETDPDGGLIMDPAIPGQLSSPYFPSTVTFYIDDIEFQ